MSRFHFYVNNWIFGKATLGEVARRVSNIGFDGVELAGEPSLYKASEVTSTLSDYGLGVSSLCGLHPGPNPDDLRCLSHPDAGKRAQAVDYIKACVDLAAGVRARSVLVVPSLVGQPSLWESKSADLARAAETLAQAAPYAAAAKILITIEPINRYEVGLVNSVGDAVHLAQTVGHPAVRAMGDTFHMQLEESDGIPAAIRRLGKYWLQHFHVADNTREAPGMGTMPWRDILRSLLEIGYEGSISFEPLPKGKHPYDAIGGNIPQDKLDADLTYGLSYLRSELTAVLRQTGVE